MITQAANEADELGWDVKVGADLDPSGRSASGLELVLDGMLHRLQEDTLLLTGAPDDQVPFGVNVRLWIHEALTQDDLATRSPIIEEALRRDPRIDSITVALTLLPANDPSGVAFLIAVKGQTIRGQAIDRIVAISQVTVEFLAQGR